MQCFQLAPSKIRSIDEPSPEYTFQNSNPIGQYIIHDYMCICTVALTTP